MMVVGAQTEEMIANDERTIVVLETLGAVLEKVSTFQLYQISRTRFVHGFRMFQFRRLVHVLVSVYWTNLVQLI